MAKHKLLITRILTQVIEVEADLPAEQDCTDGVILNAGIKEASTYFDTDWRTRDCRYSYELIDTAHPIDAAFMRELGKPFWISLSPMAQDALRKDIQDMINVEKVIDEASAVRILCRRVGTRANLRSYIGTLMSGNKSSIPLPEVMG